MKAWIVTWQSATDPVANQGKPVSVISPRVSLEKIRRHVEQLYADSKYSFGERLTVAKIPKENPYPGIIDIRPVTFRGQAAPQRLGSVTCGHNPWLYARKVTDLKVQIDGDGEEYLSWKKPDPPQLPKS